MLPFKGKVGNNVLFCPSILSADFANLQHSVEAVAPLTDWIHVDVMDGNFVPNLTIGAPVVKSLSKVVSIPTDCHLMVNRPDEYIEPFFKAGAFGITVHTEACIHIHRTIELIKSYNMSAGVAINPGTSLSAVEEIIPFVDLLLIMSVNPGFGGQKFIETSIDKIYRLKNMIIQKNSSAIIQVDGGIGKNNLRSVVDAGAKAIVAGSAIFGNTDPLQALQEFHDICADV